MRSILCIPVIFLIGLLATPSVKAQATPSVKAQATSSVRAQQHYDTLILHFAFNRYTLRPDDAGRLDRFIPSPAAKTDSLFIIGYTDTLGASDYNYRLSWLRAMAAVQFIQRLSYIQHLSLVPLNISAKGEDDPVAGDDSLSRRVLVIARHPSSHQPSASAPGTSSPFPSEPSPSANRQPDTVINLTNIHFIEDSPNLTEASRMALPAYIRSLQQYKADFIEIDGYCNSYGPITSTSDPLFKLSVRRAKLIYDYLLDEGFDSTKLSYKGLGNASPIDSHPATSDAARSNMRVEIHIFHIQPTPL